MEIDKAIIRHVFFGLLMFIPMACSSGSDSEVSLENTSIQTKSVSQIQISYPEPVATLGTTNLTKEEPAEVSNMESVATSKSEILKPIPTVAGTKKLVASNQLPPTPVLSHQDKSTSDVEEMVISIQMGSVARYKIGEQFARLPTPITAVGETSGITGKVFLDSLGNISDSNTSTIIVDVESLKSDEDKRDNWVRRNGGIGSEITIHLRKISGHPWPLPRSGKVEVVIDGDMSISGITNPVRWNGILTILENNLTGSISTEITWDQFSLSKPRLPFIISVDDEIILELDVVANIEE